MRKYVPQIIDFIKSQVPSLGSGDIFNHRSCYLGRKPELVILLNSIKKDNGEMECLKIMTIYEECRLLGCGAV
jgi:hypothetical protein